MNQRKKCQRSRHRLGEKKKKEKMTSSHEGWSEKAKQYLPWGFDPQPSCSSLDSCLPIGLNSTQSLRHYGSLLHSEPCVRYARREEGGGGRRRDIGRRDRTPELSGLQTTNPSDGW